MHVVYSPLKYNLGMTEFKILEDFKKAIIRFDWQTHSANQSKAPQWIHFCHC